MMKKMQKEVTDYIAETFGTKPFEWYNNHFQDCHGCDGYIFKSELAARRYVLRNIHEYGSLCQSACSDQAWVDILVGVGMREHDARRVVKNGRWEAVARKMLGANGPSYFLSTYSGSVSVMDNGSLLYY